MSMDPALTEQLMSNFNGGQGLAMDDVSELLNLQQQAFRPQSPSTNNHPHHVHHHPVQTSHHHHHQHQQLGGYAPKPSGGYHRPTSDYFNPTMSSSMYRPPKLINSPSMPVPIRSDPMAMFMPEAASFAYEKCGQRQSVGINGRVQNLNYRESSTEFGEFPWQVAILKRIGPSDNLYVCGGILISSSYVMTAAHCIKK